LALVGTPHPIDQPVRRLGGRRPVERHHSRWNAGAPPQLGTPPVAGVHDFDLEGTFADEFFKAMNCHVFVAGRSQVERTILRVRQE